MTSRNHRPVLEPEVEQIAVDEQRVAQIGYGIEEAVERGDGGAWHLTQVGVGDDDHARCWGGHAPS